MSAQVPAGRVAALREKGLSTGLVFWCAKEEFCFAVLVMNSIEAAQRSAAEPARAPKSQSDKICWIGQKDCGYDRQHHSCKRDLHEQEASSIYGNLLRDSRFRIVSTYVAAEEFWPELASSRVSHSSVLTINWHSRTAINS
jgi:hypothetical protein